MARETRRPPRAGRGRAAGRRAARGEGPVLHRGRADDRRLATSSEGFMPPYESTVTANLWRDGAVMLGKLNMDEFAMGSSNETSAFGPVTNPWKSPRGGNQALTPGGSSGGSASAVAADLCLAATASRHGRLDPPARRLHRHGGDQADLRPLLALRHGGLRLLARPGGADRQDGGGRGDPAVARWPAATTADSTCLDVDTPDFADARRPLGQGQAHRRAQGIPPGRHAAGDRGAVGARASTGCARRAARSSTSPCRTPNTRSRPTTSSPRPRPRRTSPATTACASAIAGRGRPSPKSTRTAAPKGFGAEVKRRVLIGAYVLSAGYYDAYYLKAQKVRRRIADDFDQAWESCDAILTPTTPSAAFALGERVSDPVSMYLNDVFTVTTNLAGLPGLSLPAGLSASGPAARPAADRQGVGRGDAVLPRRGDGAGRRLQGQARPLVVTRLRRPPADRAR